MTLDVNKYRGWYGEGSYANEALIGWSERVACKQGADWLACKHWGDWLLMLSLSVLSHVHGDENITTQLPFHADSHHTTLSNDTIFLLPVCVWCTYTTTAIYSDNRPMSNWYITHKSKGKSVHPRAKASGPLSQGDGELLCCNTWTPLELHLMCPSLLACPTAALSH